MLISWKWLENIVRSCGLTAVEAAARLTARGLEVEGFTADPTHFNDIKVARLVHIEEHPNSDHLHLVDADAGTGELIRVVCGAPGIQEGWIVPFAPVGAKLGDFKIKVSKLRGEVSNGMLCSEVELGLGSDNETLMRLPEDSPIGAPLAEVLDKGVPSSTVPFHTDIFEIGLTPDRGDCLSHWGVARELSAATGCAMTLPPLADLSDVPAQSFVSIENSTDCPRYMGIRIDRVKVGPSPAWLRRAVEACGARSINNVVDITNFVCFEFGQPMHAFDADKLYAPRIAVRRALPGERLQAINHETYALNETDIVITDGITPIAIAGVMGGAETEVDEASQNIIFEIAAFNPTSVRKTSKRLGLHSESSHRYERFVDPHNIETAARRAVWLLQQTQDSPLCITARADNYPAPADPIALTLRTDRVKEMLGVAFSGKELEKLLRPIGFDAETWDSDVIHVKAPTWRSDITREIDIIEEISRGYGFDRFPACLPDVALKCPHKLRSETINPTPYPVEQPLWDRRERARLHDLREALIDMGLDECMHYTFMDPSDPTRCLFAPDSRENAPMKIANPMSIEHSTMRTTMLPSMLGALLKNITLQQKSLAMFEVGEVFFPSVKNTGVTCLDEEKRLSIMFWGTPDKRWFNQPRPWDVYDLKGIIEGACKAIDLPIVIDQSFAPVPYLHDGIQAAVIADGIRIGSFGELHPLVLRSYKIDGPVFYAELSLDRILGANTGLRTMKPLPRFHFSTRDLSMVVKRSVTFNDIAAVIESVRPAVLESYQIFDVYTGKQILPGLQSISLTFRYRDPLAADADKGHALTDDEVNSAHAVIVNALNDKLEGHVR